MHTLDDPYVRQQYEAGQARESSMRPHAEKVCAQYQRGLITVEELRDELGDILQEQAEKERLASVCQTCEMSHGHASYCPYAWN